MADSPIIQCFAPPGKLCLGCVDECYLVGLARAPGIPVRTLPAIRSVLAAYRTTAAHITQEQIQAAWTEYQEVTAQLAKAGPADV